MPHRCRLASIVVAIFVFGMVCTNSQTLAQSLSDSIAKSTGVTLSSKPSSSSLSGNGPPARTGSVASRVSSGTASTKASEANIVSDSFDGTSAQGGDARVIQGVNTVGTIRVNNQWILEATLIFVANAMEIGGIVWGVFCLFQAGMLYASRPRAPYFRRLILGLAVLTIGLATPGAINWIVPSERDCGGVPFS